MSSFLNEFFRNSFWTSPYIIIDCIGLFICLYYKKRNKSQAYFGLFAFVFFLLHDLISILLRVPVFTTINPSIISNNISRAKLSIYCFEISTVISITAWVFLLSSMYYGFKSVRSNRPPNP